MCVAPYWLLQKLQGIWRTKSFTCPVAMIERYFSSFFNQYNGLREASPLKVLGR